MLFLLKTILARNGLLCADVPLRNYSLTLLSSSDQLSQEKCRLGCPCNNWLE